MFQDEARDQVGAPGVANGMYVAQVQCFQEAVGVLPHRRHRVVFIPLRIVGKTLAYLVDRIDVKPLRQSVEV